MLVKVYQIGTNCVMFVLITVFIRLILSQYDEFIFYKTGFDNCFYPIE